MKNHDVIEETLHPNQLMVRDQENNLQLIPPELKKFDHWVVWKIEILNGKPTKVPNDANTRGIASTDNPKTWATFEQAERVLTRCKGYTGVGFVFSKDDPFIGLDWDHVRDPDTGVIEEAILNEEIIPLGSYAEISPSGTGVHVIAIGTVPGDRRKGNKREMYDSGRYFTMTGRHLDGTPETVNEIRRDALSIVYQRMVGNRALQKLNELSTAGCKPQLKLSDEEIIAQCLLAKNSIKFTTLFEDGDKSGYETHSEADMALCGILVFYTQDVTQIDRIFRQSRLYRPKWDEMRGSMTYGQRTIGEALTGTLSQYNPHGTITRGQSWRIPVRKMIVNGEEEDLWKM